MIIDFNAIKHNIVGSKKANRLKARHRINSMQA